MPTDLQHTLEHLRAAARRLSSASPGPSDIGPLLESLPAAALVADNEGRYVAANPAACELTGYAARELLQLWVWNLTPDDHGHQYERLWRAFLDRGEQTGEYVLLTKAGDAVPVAYVAQTHLLPGLHLSLLERK